MVKSSQSGKGNWISSIWKGAGLYCVAKTATDFWIGAYSSSMSMYGARAGGVK